MTKEEALKILRKDSLSNLVDYYSSGELQDAIDTIVSQPSLPSNIDEAAEELALKAYPEKDALNKKATGHYDPNYPRRKAYQQGYEQAEKELIPLINRLCEAILFEWKDAAEFEPEYRAALAWLERQKESELLNNDEYHTVKVKILDRLYAHEKELEQLKKKQKPAEWSEIDKLHLNNAILVAKKEWGVNSYTARWLESLRDNYKKCNSRWKPSEEQVKAREE